jgi:hypothetical protein
MKLNKETKEKIGVIFGGLLILALTGILFGAAIKGYKNSTIDLNKVDMYEGEVTDRGIGLKKGSNIFYFRMEGLDDLLASYNMKKDYSKLMSSIEKGDFIKVYFKESKYEDFNLDVIQIEKDNKILLDKSEFETKESSLIYFGTIGGLIMLGIFISMIASNRKVFNKYSR